MRLSPFSHDMTHVHYCMLNHCEALEHVECNTTFMLGVAACLIPISNKIVCLRQYSCIETGRQEDGTLLEHRNCNLCQRDEIDSEMPYLQSCD